MNTAIRNKTVLVTGGAGFIGSHIVEEIVAQGSRAIVLDDLSTGSPRNLAHLPDSSYRFVSGSVCDRALLKSVFDGVDFVFHEAAIASVPKSIDDPVQSHEVNLTGTLNVLNAARENGVKKVVFASSSALYGNSTALSLAEDVPPDPQSPYAVTKLAAEYYCDVFRKVYGLATVCLRYFNVYGPRQSAESDYAAVIPKFISRISQGKPPIIFGDGLQSRDFIFVKDVVAANMLALEDGASGIYNVGTGESIDLNHLADTVISLTDVRQHVVHEAGRPGEVRHSRGNIDKLRSLGFRPSFTVEEGVRALVASLPKTKGVA